MKKSNFVAPLLLAFLSTGFAQELSTSAIDVPQELASLGKVTTYYYQLEPEQIFDYMIRDIKENRTHFSKSLPSYLDKHITHVKLVDGSIYSLSSNDAQLQQGASAIENTIAPLSIANIQATQVFTSGAGSVCYSSIKLIVSIQGPVSNNSTNFSRDCNVPSPAGEASNFFANWARSTITSTTTGLGRMLAYYNLTYEANYNSSTPNLGLRSVNFRPKTTGVGTEVNGTIYFNTYGGTAVSSEIVFNSATWQ